MQESQRNVAHIVIDQELLTDMLNSAVYGLARANNTFTSNPLASEFFHMSHLMNATQEAANKVQAVRCLLDAVDLV